MTTIDNIQEGQHTVTLKMEGYEDFNQTVLVVSGIATEVNTVLIPSTIAPSPPDKTCEGLGFISKMLCKSNLPYIKNKYL